jgi:hypothetical protein
MDSQEGMIDKVYILDYFDGTKIDGDILIVKVKPVAVN